MGQRGQPVKLHRFTEIGIERFDRFRATSLRRLDQLHAILRDVVCSDLAGSDIEVECRELSTRFAIGKYLHALFDHAIVPDLVTDQGIWTWLSAFYFEQLCPPGSQPGDRARWVPAVGNYRQYYRHLLAGPFLIYRAHHDNPCRAMALLANPPHQHGDIVEQLASRQELVTNPSVMEAATKLYIDPETGRLKRGTGSKGPGSPRRLVTILNQLDLTWDLYKLETQKLLDLLPAEFDRFKQ